MNNHWTYKYDAMMDVLPEQGDTWPIESGTRVTNRQPYTPSAPNNLWGAV